MTTSYKILLTSIVCCTAFIGCKPKIFITKNQYIEKGQHAPVPYTIYNSGSAPEHTLLVLPSALDSFKIEEAPFLSTLLKNNYQIIVIHKPTEGNYYNLQSMDFAGQRENEIISTTKFLKEKGLLSADSLNILGLGEGAYLIPLVAIQLKANKVIFVNGGPFSQLLEIERLAKKDSLSSVELTFITEHFEVKSKEELLVKVGRVKAGRATEFILGGKANLYWLSYHQNVLSDAYTKYIGEGHWILFEDYALNHPSNAQYVKLLNGIRNDKKGRVSQLEGNGTYNPENLEKISEVVESILLN